MDHQIIPNHAERRVGSGRALVFAPHPDDEVFGCGGSIMRHVADGDPVQVIIVTDGGFDPGNSDTQRYIHVREQESICASKIIGYGTPIFWRLQDRSLTCDTELIAKLKAAVEEYSPDYVYAPSARELHPDHQSLNCAIVEALRQTRREIILVMYEISVPLDPNLLLDISELENRKSSAMKCFSSQLAKQNYDKQITALNRFRTYTLPQDVSAAEAYKIVKANNLAVGVSNKNTSAAGGKSATHVSNDKARVPLVSVVVRSIGRPLLSDALESIAAQTYANIEVIVVNALGSGHARLGEKCGSHPLRFLDSQKSLQRSIAANHGLKAATGKYVIFLDDDDFFHSIHIENLVDSLEKSEAFKVAYTGIQCYARTPEGEWEKERVYNDPYDPIRLLYSNYLPIHAVMFNREILEKGCKFDEKLELCEDWDFWLQLARYSNFLHVDGVTAGYRILQDSGSGVWLNQATARDASLRLFRKWVPQFSDQELFGIMDHARDKFALETKHAHSFEKLKEYEMKLDKNNQLLSDRTAELMRQYEQTKLKDAQLSDMNASLQRCRTELENIYSSTSWKITLFLRRVISWVKRVIPR